MLEGEQNTGGEKKERKIRGPTQFAKSLGFERDSNENKRALTKTFYKDISVGDTEGQLVLEVSDTNVGKEKGDKVKERFMLSVRLKGIDNEWGNTRPEDVHRLFVNLGLEEDEIPQYDQYGYDKGYKTVLENIQEYIATGNLEEKLKKVSEEYERVNRFLNAKVLPIAGELFPNYGKDDRFNKSSEVYLYSETEDKVGKQPVLRIEFTKGFLSFEYIKAHVGQDSEGDMRVEDETVGYERYGSTIYFPGSDFEAVSDEEIRGKIEAAKNFFPKEEDNA